jgi:deazaflavin-dependent oxidoreductase (nitroreductase family)
MITRTAFRPRGLPLAWLLLLFALACAVLMNNAGFRRWLYRGRRPNRIAKIMNRWAAALASRGVASGGLVTLEVTGRRSGRTVSLPLVMVAVGGRRYLVSMLGEDVQWVRNVRAAGGRAVVRGGGREEALLEEVPAGRRAPILKAYLQAAPGARWHLPVEKDAPLSEFERVSPRYPVFRVVPTHAA